MDLSIVLDDWSYDDKNESNNIRKIVGVDGLVKLQIRLRCGAVQWELEDRPDGQRPYGLCSVLEYCESLLNKYLRLAAKNGKLKFELDTGLVKDLEEEMFDYYKRCLALFKIRDYRHAVQDAAHNLSILELIRQYAKDKAGAFRYDHYRPRFLLDSARAQALLHLDEGLAQPAIEALSHGVCEIEGFHREYDMEDKIPDNKERKILIDLRRSVREKYNVPLTDEELLYSLQAEQKVAIDEEDYEMAARLRDKIKSLKQKVERKD